MAAKITTTGIDGKLTQAIRDLGDIMGIINKTMKYVEAISDKLGIDAELDELE